MQPYRSSFNVVVADSQVGRGGEIADALANAGYVVEHRLTRASLLDGVLQSPPHIVLVHFEDTAFFAGHGPNAHTSLFEALVERLPEAQILVLAGASNTKNACELYGEGIFDVVNWPVTHPRQLLSAIDRAAQVSYHRFLNEQNRGILANGSSDDAPFARFEMWLKEFNAATSMEQAREIWMKGALRELQTDTALYLTYIEARRSLVVSQSTGALALNLQNVGLDLDAQEPGFEPSLLKQPHTLRCLHDFVIKGLGRESAAYYPVEYRGRVQGIFIVPARPQQIFSDDAHDRAFLKSGLHVLRDRFERLEDKKRLRKFSVYDDVSEAFHSEFMARKIKEEVSRARRILKPVSLLFVSLDSYDDMTLSQTEDTLERLIKAFADILVKNSRLNDLVGRLNRENFLLCLPHTDRRGAAVKAERLRRLIERADFSQVLGSAAKITVSVGVSEYPTLCRDSDELLGTAEAAMLDVRRSHGNRICLAAAPAKFVPDFVVNDAKDVSADRG